MIYEYSKCHKESKRFLEWEIILDNPGGPSVIIRVLVSERGGRRIGTGDMMTESEVPVMPSLVLTACGNRKGRKTL